jgi:AraC family transcriptional regulator, transcriptional activator of pobA
MPTIPVHNLGAKNLKKEGFDIIALNHAEDHDYEGVVPHRHNFYELLVFKKGGGKHEIDFKEYNIEENSVHFVSPTQVHRLKSAAARGQVFCFSEEFVLTDGKTSFTEVYPFYDFNTYLPTIKMDDKTFKALEEILVILNSAFFANSTLKNDIVRCHFQVVLLKIKEFFITNTISKTNLISSSHPKIVEFKKQVNAHYINHLSASQYAQSLHISPSYLNSLCKKETGRTVTELVHERLLLESKRMLYSTGLSVKEISNHLNFDSVAYFSRFFKKQVGQTPVDYRSTFGK